MHWNGPVAYYVVKTASGTSNITYKVQKLMYNTTYVSSTIARPGSDQTLLEIEYGICTFVTGIKMNWVAVDQCFFEQGNTMIRGSGV